MKKTKIADNLYIYETDKGSRSYVFRGTVGGKRIERGLGAVESQSLRDAKRKAAAVLLSEPEEKKPELKTFAETYAEAVTEIGSIRRWKNSRMERSWDSQIEQYALPVIGALALSAIGRDDVLAVLRPLWTAKPTVASALRMRLEAVFDWAATRGYRSGLNPAVWRGNLALFLPPQSKVHEEEHHEAPTIEELRNAVKLALASGGEADRALVWIIATACRNAEACLADASEVSGSEWTIDPAHQKTRIHQRVPLSSLAEAALSREPGRMFDVGCNTVLLRLKKYCPRPEGQPQVTVHGIRSTFRDWCADNGVADAVAERCLSHQWGNSVTRAYYRNDLFEQRKAVMQAWADALMG